MWHPLNSRTVCCPHLPDQQHIIWCSPLVWCSSARLLPSLSPAVIKQTWLQRLTLCCMHLPCMLSVAYCVCSRTSLKSGFILKTDFRVLLPVSHYTKDYRLTSLRTGVEYAMAIIFACLSWLCITFMCGNETTKCIVGFSSNIVLVVSYQNRQTTHKYVQQSFSLFCDSHVLQIQMALDSVLNCFLCR